MRTFHAYRSMGLLLALILVAAAHLFTAGCASDSAGQESGAAPPPPEVVVTRVARADVPLYMEYMGQTAGSREVEVRARVGGILLRRAFEEGQPIRQGDLMFEIDPAPYQAALEQATGTLGQAEARLSRAKRELGRMEKLHADGVVSQKDRDDAQTEFESATAEVESARGKVKEARINLGYTKVEAPISGMTSRETRSEGSLVSLTSDASRLTTISKVDPIYVNFSIPNSEMLRLRRLTEEGRVVFGPEGTYVARLVLPDGREYPHAGRINFTDTQVDPTTGVVKTRASFPNPDNIILPGQFVRIKLQGAALRDAVVVPQGAVLRTQQANIVWVVDDAGVVAPRPVVMGEPVGNDSLIEQGLVGGERVIVEGVIKVRPGLTVRVRENGQPKTQAQPGQPGQPTQPAQPAQAGQPAQPAQATQPVQAAQPGQPAQPAQPAQSGQPPQPGQTAQSGQTAGAEQAR